MLFRGGTWTLIAAGSWFGMCVAIFLAALWLRFMQPYHATNQLVVFLLLIFDCILATMALICALPLILWTAPRPGAAKLAAAAVLVPVVSAFTLQILAMESPAENQAKNIEYLKQQAAILSRYAREHGRMPPSFERALESSGTTLLQRGDADGRDVSYRRLNDRQFLICGSQARLHLLVEADRTRVETWSTDESDPCWASGEPQDDPPQSRP